MVNRKLQTVILALGFCMLGCPGETPIADAGPRRDVGQALSQPDAGSWNFTPFDAGPPPPEGKIEGRIVTADGEGVANVDILCCSPSTCLIYTTDETGNYTYNNIPIGPRKMRTFDHEDRYRSALWHQVVIEAETTGLRRPVVMFEQQVKTEWAGSSVVLADGRLELTAPESGIIFPTEEDRSLAAREVTPDQFSPPDIDPWGEDSTGVISFLFEPAHVHSEGSIQVTVRGVGAELVGTVYDVWTVDDSTAEATKAGVATVNAQGDLVTNADCEVHALDALAFVPQGE